MGCNVTFEVVNVDTTFIGTDLDMGPQNPPRPREDTVRDSTVKTRHHDGDYDHSVQPFSTVISSETHLCRVGFIFSLW